MSDELGPKGPKISPGFEDGPSPEEEESDEETISNESTPEQPPIDPTLDTGAGGSYFWDMQSIIKKATEGLDKK